MKIEKNLKENRSYRSCKNAKFEIRRIKIIESCRPNAFTNAPLPSHVIYILMKFMNL